ncbi:GtrA family protein [Fodinicola feengrottensis]
MSLVRSLIQRWRRLIGEMTAFGIIGVINTGVQYAGVNFFHLALGLNVLIANVLATVISATSSYFMNRHWTFRHRSRSSLHREYILFFIFNGIGLAISSAVLWLFTYPLHLTSALWVNVAITIGLVLGTLFRFFTYSKWVFKHPDDALYEQDDEPTAATEVVPDKTESRQ